MEENTFKKNEQKNDSLLKNILAFVIDIVKVVIISSAIVLPIRYFLIQPFFVSGASMEPNFYNGEYLIIDEINYRFDDPKRGEVVVFKYPKNPKEYYIKRIIGLPGERIEISGGKIFIYNGQYPQGFILDESNYLPGGETTSSSLSILLEQNQYFVLGDNRQYSSDSRVWGSLPRGNIIGRVWLRAWPITQAGFLKAPSY